MSANLLRVISGANNIVPETQEGSSSFTDLCGSPESAKHPIVAGVWDLLDIYEPTPVWEAEWDEVKYVIAGELVLKDESDGSIHALKAGSMLWIPVGAKMSIVRSKGVRTVYVEQTYRPTKPLVATGS